MKLGILAIWAVSIFVAVAAAQQPSLPADVDKQVDEMVKKFRVEHTVPGLSVAVGHNGRIVYHKGFGQADVENEVPATDMTVYRTASIAKPITATAVLQLVQQGNIDLDEDIRTYCPEFPEKEWPITVRKLLCMQSGVRHYDNNKPGEATGTMSYSTIEDSLELFKDDPLLFKPGTKYNYTTYGYSLLGRAVETASGMPFRKYLRENVFGPTDMHQSTIDDTRMIIPRRSRGYAKLGESSHRFMARELKEVYKPNGIYNASLHDTSMKVPGGGLVSTPVDLVKFAQAHLANELIDEELRTEAWTAAKLADGSETTYGYGWNVSTAEDGIKLVGHSGGQAGTSTFLIIVPEFDLVVATMCNLQGTPISRLARDIGKALAPLASKK